ncbi:MAG: hypothetical protein ACOYEA_07995 [Fermentimonas sp.]|jgi:hypothetical protein
MQKIDHHDFERFMRAMKKLAEEMDMLDEEMDAKRIVMHASELESAYLGYRMLVEQLSQQVTLYFEMFDKAHDVYRRTVRIRSRIETEARNANKRLEQKKKKEVKMEREKQ